MCYQKDEKNYKQFKNFIMNNRKFRDLLQGFITGADGV